MACERADTVQLHWNLSNKSPCIKPKGGIKISKFLIAQTQRSSSGDMHDRVLCVPLYTILTQVKSSAANGNYSRAFELVEGMLLALYGEC